MEAQENRNQFFGEVVNKELDSLGTKDKKEIIQAIKLDSLVYVAPWHVYDQPS